MIPTGPAPTPDELVETLFDEVLLAPDGYEYHHHDGQLLYPVLGQDKWRLLLKKKGTEQVTPVFLEGAFILKLTKALYAMQRELNQAVSEEIPEPATKAVQ
jgi:hypothetical protein